MLQRPNGTFLLAQRPPDKIWDGYWEFPGGKVEPGETSQDALLRELREELGIEVETAYPWITRVFTYPHATVQLNFFRVTQWRGQLHPHEGQVFSWQQANAVKVAPLLPANAPVLRALALPPLYAISNVGELGEETFLSRLEQALERGLRLVQLREKEMPREALGALAQRMLPRLRRYGARLIINGDIALVQETGADGVQLSAAQLAGLKTRPDVAWCGASCHNAEELRRAEALDCDFALLSPVLPTRTHPGAPALGWAAFAALARQCAIPVYALGGLGLADTEVAWRHGAHGVALLRQAWPKGSSSRSSGDSSTGIR